MFSNAGIYNNKLIPWREYFEFLNLVRQANFETELKLDGKIKLYRKGSDLNDKIKV
jgi:hypothetical protein